MFTGGCEEHYSSHCFHQCSYISCMCTWNIEDYVRMQQNSIKLFNVGHSFSFYFCFAKEFLIILSLMWWHPLMISIWYRNMIAFIIIIPWLGLFDTWKVTHLNLLIFRDWSYYISFWYTWLLNNFFCTNISILAIIDFLEPHTKESVKVENHSYMLLLCSPRQGWMPLDYLATSFGGWGQLSHRFYCLEASSNGSSLEKFPTLLKKKKKKKKWFLLCSDNKLVPKFLILYLKMFPVSLSLFDFLESACLLKSLFLKLPTFSYNHSYFFILAIHLSLFVILIVPLRVDVPEVVSWDLFYLKDICLLHNNL